MCKLAKVTDTTCQGIHLRRVWVHSAFSIQWYYVIPYSIRMVVEHCWALLRIVGHAWAFFACLSIVEHVCCIIVHGVEDVFVHVSSCLSLDAHLMRIFRAHVEHFWSTL